MGEIKTPFGPSQPVYHIHNSDVEMLFLSRYGEKGYSNVGWVKRSRPITMKLKTGD